jgi:hypothetical protein
MRTIQTAGTATGEGIYCRRNADLLSGGASESAVKTHVAAKPAQAVLRHRVHIVVFALEHGPTG